MRRFVGFLFVATWCCGQPAERSVSSPPPTYEIRHTSQSITVDGRLDEPAWKDAAPLVLQFPWEEQTGAKQKTTARLLWNDDTLFIAFECDDKDIAARFDQRDDPTYRDDAVEIFIQPDSQQPIYVGLEMNVRAILYDYAYIYPQVLLKGFDLKGVTLAAKIDGTLNVSSDQDKGWTLEVAIPLRNFSELMSDRRIVSGTVPTAKQVVPAHLRRGARVVPGTVWTANLNRWDGAEPNRRLSIWSDSAIVRPDPHNPNRFGQLIFVK